jgi:hypothetical protein
MNVCLGCVHVASYNTNHIGGVMVLGDLKTLLALFLKQKRVRKFTCLDPIQCEKNTCTISNRVQFSLKTRVQFNAIRQQMKQKKARVQFYML